MHIIWRIHVCTQSAILHFTWCRFCTAQPPHIHDPVCSHCHMHIIWHIHVCIYFSHSTISWLRSSHRWRKHFTWCRLCTAKPPHIHDPLCSHCPMHIIWHIHVCIYFSHSTISWLRSSHRWRRHFTWWRRTGRRGITMTINCWLKSLASVTDITDLLMSMFQTYTLLENMEREAWSWHDQLLALGWRAWPVLLIQLICQLVCFKRTLCLREYRKRSMIMAWPIGGPRLKSLASVIDISDKCVGMFQMKLWLRICKEKHDN